MLFQSVGHGKMEFYGIADVDNLEVTVGGKAIETERIYDGVIYVR